MKLGARSLKIGFLAWAFGIVLSVVAAMFIQKINAEHAEAAFQADSTRVYRAISRSLEEHVLRLRALGSYFDTRYDVTRAEFARYAANLAQGSAGLQALEWIPRVPESKRNTLETIARFSGLSGFEFKERGSDGSMIPAGRSEIYYPVYFVEPVPPNVKALGFDLASDPARKAALEHSRDTGQITFTAPIKLVQENGTQSGMLAFRPVYRRDMVSETPQSRAQGIRGFALGVFRIGDIVEAAIPKQTGDLGFRLLDNAAAPEKRLLYTSIEDTSGEGAWSYDGPMHSVSMAVYPRDWVIEFVPLADHALREVDWVALSTFIAGLLMTGLLAATVATLHSRKSYAEQIVREQTSDLVARSRELEFQKHALDAHCIVSIADIRGNITYANDKFCETSGYSREELIDQNHRILKSDEHPPEYYSELWRTITAGEVWQGEIKNRKKDGGFYWVNVTIVPFLDERGVPFQYVAIRTDVSTEKQRSLELTEATKAAEAANSAKSNFLATMSHEIRTPLNGVLGLAQLLGDTQLNADQRKKVDTILASGQTLLSIINDVLDMSRIEAGGVELENTVFDLTNLVSMIATPFQSLADDKGLTLALTDRLDPSMVLKGDPVRLRQILWNLLSNAIKFTEDGSVRLIVEEIRDGRNKAKTAKDHLLHFAVEDTGAGIASSRLGAIFDSFTQEDSSITRKFGGTGLGLSIAKQLTEMMGGTIEVSSEIGEGTRFDVYIPFNRATPREAESLQEALSTTRERTEQPMKVLVAEDNTVNAMIAESFLKKFGHEVRVVETGIQAVEVAAEGWADLVLMDIHLPEMDGIDATRMIRSSATGENLPIVGLTAEAFAERHAQFLEAGMNDVLTKPFTEPQLADVLARNQRAAGPVTGERNRLPAPEDAGTDDNGAVECGPFEHDGPNGESAWSAPIGDVGKLSEFRGLMNGQTVSRLLQTAQKSLAERMDELRLGLASSDAEEVRNAAHAIRGSSGSMFAERMAAFATMVEENSTDIDFVREVMPALEETAENTIKWWRDQSN